MQRHSTRTFFLMLIAGMLICGCGEDEGAFLEPLAVEQGALSSTQVLVVTVTLDGEPVAGVEVAQGGNTSRWLTDSEGRATVYLDLEVDGELFVMALHPEARTKGSYVFEGDAEAVVVLERFSPVDNEEYEFTQE